jgi:hypothetical protein
VGDVVRGGGIVKRPTPDQYPPRPDDAPPADRYGRGWYERRELGRVLDAGPHDDETWYRLQVSGRETSKHLSISEATLRRILDVVADGATS